VKKNSEVKFFPVSSMLFFFHYSELQNALWNQDFPSIRLTTLPSNGIRNYCFPIQNYNIKW
jgi:hypothetical protein